MNNNIASPILRLLSGLIDGLILFAITFLFILKISVSTNLFTLMDSLLGYFLVFLFFSLFSPFVISFMISYFGGTIGKLLTDTRIVDSKGKYLSFWRAFYRNHLGYMVSGVFLWLGFVWILKDREKQGWHDIMAGSWVIVRKKVGLILGIISVFILLGLNYFLVKTTVTNFLINKSVYLDIYEDVKKSFEKETPDENSIPQEDFTLDESYEVSLLI